MTEWETQEEWKDYFQLVELAKKYHFIIVDVESARFFSKSLREKEHLDIMADTLDGLCDIYGEKNEQDRTASGNKKRD